MDSFLGEIRMFGGNFAPLGWAFCNGQLLSISENEALFSLIGTAYGGDGQSTFALPDLRGRLPLHQGPSDPLGTMSGVESVTLNTAQVPAHTHALVATSAAAASPVPGGALLARADDFAAYANAAPTTELVSGAVSPAGNGQPHDNIQPFLCVSFIIALEGIYPSQG
jgi:microcystin-dependent protein